MRTVIRLFAIVATTCALAAAPAAAQVSVPNIRKPIDAAKSAAAKTNAQIEASQQVAAPAPSAQGSAQSPSATKAPATKAPTPGRQQGKAPAAGATTQVSESGRQGATLTVMREAFTYNRSDRRDPFVSLMASGELRPVVTDLVLTGVIYDESGRGRGSIAMLVDNSTGKPYSVRIGTQLARMRVTRIGRESVTFDIDEFGLSRSETLVIDKTKAGTPAPRRP